MPLKNGRLTKQERAVARGMAEWGSTTTVAQRLRIPAGSVHAAMARPAVQAEYASQVRALLFSDILPLAVAAHKRVLSDPRTPAGALNGAIKLAYDRTLGLDDVAGSKEPHEMTPEELATAIAALERAASDKARPIEAIEAKVIEVETRGETAENGGIFT